MSRPKEEEKKIAESAAGKKSNIVKTSSYNTFQYNVDIRYEFSDKETVFAIDDEFMDAVNDFFERCLKRCEA